ncbi:MAG TPA: hypothetical protein VME86_17035 [Acidobacteriaceae bacterium]|nr:hypothetical protein [Acidobacteriaceae bacterium]
MGISDRLTRLALFYHREAKKCAKGRAYLAACVMQGAALEASLHAMCFLYPEKVKVTGVYQKKKFRRKRSKALDFKFHELIDIADELSWFPSKKITWGRRTTLAGFAHELRKLRNYVHPGVWAPEHPETMKFTKGVYGVAYEIFDVANSWLLHQVHVSLRKRMEREGLL